MNIKECLPVFNKEELKKLHTKQLLKLRISKYGNFNYDCNYCEHYKECKAICESNDAILYSILNTREHIPSKQESKAKRKERKKKGK
jgi:hypothetical protein